MINIAKLKRKIRRKPVQYTRNAVQIAFAIFLLYAGWQFYQFYLHFATFGATPYVERPVAVEGFLPISALVALWVWITTWNSTRCIQLPLSYSLSLLLQGLFFGKPFAVGYVLLEQ